MEKSGWIELPARGNSMYPLIRKGDVCRFIPCDPFLLKKGDIVLFRSSAGLITAHRICYMEKSEGFVRFLLKGDANLGYDEPVEQKQIIGKLIWIRKSRVKIKVDTFPACAWGKLMFTFPILTSLLWKHLNKKKP